MAINENDVRVWVEARKRHRLSHAHVQMARELGMNPKKLGRIDNHKQEPWKLPLPEFIQELYFKRFRRIGRIPLCRSRIDTNNSRSNAESGTAVRTPAGADEEQRNPDRKAPHY